MCFGPVGLWIGPACADRTRDLIAGDGAVGPRGRRPPRLDDAYAAAAHFEARRRQCLNVGLHVHAGRGGGGNRCDQGFLVIGRVGGATGCAPVAADVDRWCGIGDVAGRHDRLHRLVELRDRGGEQTAAQGCVRAGNAKNKRGR